MKGGSFSVAAKHLFRHLHEASELRANPLVRHFFEQTPANGLERARDDRAALEKIHQLIRRAAQECRDVDSAAGKEQRARRQHAIVALQCLQRRPIREVAESLGISHYHCYRERAAICRRIAARICRRENKPLGQALPEIDEFQLLIESARRRAALVGADTMKDFDRLARRAPTGQKKIEALCAGAVIGMQLGNVEWAQHAYAAASDIFGRELIGRRSRAALVAQANIELLRGSLAYHRGENAEALVLAQRAAERLEPQSTQISVRELYAESLYSWGAAAWSFGQTETAYDALRRASRVLERRPRYSMRLRARIAASSWKLQNYRLLCAGAWCPASERLAGMAAAFDLAYASGWVSEACEALIAMTEHHALTEDDDGALRTGRLAVFLAREQLNELVLAHIAFEVGVRLLSTRYWEFGVSLAGGSDSQNGLSADHHALRSYCDAMRALHRRDFRTARALSGNPRNDEGRASLSIRRQLIAAVAAHALGQPRDASAMLESALATAERFCFAPLLRDAYNAANTITGDAHFKERAIEIAHALTA